MTTHTKKKIIAISGSTRKNSTNHQLLRAIARLTTEQFDLVFWEGLSDLPAYSPDEDTDLPPVSVQRFRQLLKEADGVIICTPEYAHGVPGSLKNALDWTVSTADLSGKPTVLITASTDGRYGHAALLETLKVIEAKDVDQLQLLIQFARTKVSPDKGISDERTLGEVKQLMTAFQLTIP